MWDNVLVSIGNGTSEVLGPLERELIIRRFNLNELGMEDPNASTDLEKIVGAGKRLYIPSEGPSELRPVVDFYYSYFKRVAAVFRTTKVATYFGLSIKEALSLPVSQWYEIEREAKHLAEIEPPSESERMTEIIKSLIETMMVRPE